MVENLRFDVFIAYASADAEFAARLHAVQTAVGHRVVLDREGLTADAARARRRSGSVTRRSASGRSTISDGAGSSRVWELHRQINAGRAAEGLVTFLEDDVIDALAAAVTARLAEAHGVSTLTLDPPVDGSGLPMEIVYCQGRRGPRL